MTYEDWMELFAKIVVICLAVTILIDLAAEFKVSVALRLKWSLFWYSIRYVGYGCAIALAISVVRT
jgi:hypothetical protein